MLLVDWIQLIVFFLILLLLTRFFGGYLCSVLDPKGKTIFDPIFKKTENFIYRVCNIGENDEHDWKEYLFALLAFSFVSLVFTMVILAFQYYLPLNPEKLKAPSWHLNLNIGISFMTNTNWESYSPEKTLSYFSQMVGLAVQNFVSGAVGLATAAAIVRGIARKESSKIGNFWKDLIRINLYLLIPICVIGSIVFISEGVPQNFSPFTKVKTLENEIQTIAQGPIASQETIKLLGTNGGGFMNANASHPYENPTPFSNFFQMVLILLIPASQIYYFGKSVGNIKHGWCIFAAVSIIFLAGVIGTAYFEYIGNPQFEPLGITTDNFEGKETRFGIFSSAFYACVTTVVSCGSVNCMHDSLTPLGGLIPLLNMQLSEVVFGGMGAGLYSVLLFVVMTIFISGLIIGRTPEYLGKKIEIYDIKMTVLGILPYVLLVHLFTALASYCHWGASELGNRGAHGFSEILYAYSSAAANNGSSFAGLNANNVGYNVTTALAMLLGRFLVIAPVIALAGSLVKKKVHPETAASFPLSSVVFVLLLIGIIILVGALTFLPALTMGPILDQFSMLHKVLFP